MRAPPDDLFTANAGDIGMWFGETVLMYETDEGRWACGLFMDATGRNAHVRVHLRRIVPRAKHRWFARDDVEMVKSDQIVIHWPTPGYVNLGADGRSPRAYHVNRLSRGKSQRRGMSPRMLSCRPVVPARGLRNPHTYSIVGELFFPEYPSIWEALSFLKSGERTSVALAKSTALSYVNGALWAHYGGKRIARIRETEYKLEATPVVPGKVLVKRVEQCLNEMM